MKNHLIANKIVLHPAMREQALSRLRTTFSSMSSDSAAKLQVVIASVEMLKAAKFGAYEAQNNDWTEMASSTLRATHDRLVSWASGVVPTADEIAAVEHDLWRCQQDLEAWLNVVGKGQIKKSAG